MKASADIPLQVQFLPEALFIRASDSPDALAYEAQGQHLAWSELLAQVLQAATALTAAGVEPGSTCALILPSSLDFVRAIFAAQLVGAIPVAINPKAPLSQSRRRMDELGCTVAVMSGNLLASAALREAFSGITMVDPAVFSSHTAAPRSALPQLSPERLSHLQLTSGTSGSPKAVMLTHANVMASLAASHDLLEPRASDRLVGWLPLHHDLGLLRLVFQPLYFGIGSHLIEPSVAAIRTWLETIAAVGGTLTAAPDFAYRLAVRLVPSRTLDLRSLRAATNGGEPVRLSSVQAFEQHFGVPGVVHPGYGLAEATLGVAVVRPGDPLQVDPAGNVACGRPLKGVSIRIADDTGALLPAGAAGRILIRGPMVFQGYLHDAAATADVFHDGWFDTGDVGRVDDAGQLFVLGRTRAMIKRGGATIAPREIEELTDAIEGVRRSAAIGLRAGSDSLTDDVVIVAEVERSLSEAQRTLVRDAAADATRDALGFVPRAVILISPGALPRTATGKIRYDELRTQLETNVLQQREP